MIQETLPYVAEGILIWMVADSLYTIHVAGKCNRMIKRAQGENKFPRAYGPFSYLLNRSYKK